MIETFDVHGLGVVLARITTDLAWVRLPPLALVVVCTELVRPSLQG